MAKSFLVDINLNKNELQNAIVQNLATNPSNPKPGQVYFNTTTNRFRVYTGTEWDEMGTGGGTVTSVDAANTDGSLTISGNPITSSGTITVDHTNTISAVTTSGIYPIKIDANGHITEYGSAVTILKKYAATITGDASKTSFAITHNLGSRDVTVQVYDGTSYEEVIVDVTRTSTSVVTIGFASAPATGATYRVVVIG